MRDVKGLWGCIFRLSTVILNWIIESKGVNKILCGFNICFGTNFNNIIGSKIFLVKLLLYRLYLNSISLRSLLFVFVFSHQLCISPCLVYLHYRAHLVHYKKYAKTRLAN